MSLDFFKSNRTHMRNVRRSKESVQLGDGDTCSPILFVVKCKLRFYEAGPYDIKGGTTSRLHYDVNLTANVFDTKGYDIIIGKPTLLSKMLKFFVGLCIHSADNAYDFQVQQCFSILPEHKNHRELLEPFKKHDEDAPEEANAPEPAHGTHVPLSEEDIAERERLYMEQQESHVSEELKKNTRLMKMLRGLGKEVFVHWNWDGINGIPEVEFQFKDLPPSHRCKARNINPKLAEDFYKEFTRLCVHLFVPSDSHFVSPIVVAPKKTRPFIRVCGDFTWLNKHIVMPIVPIPNVIESLIKISGFKLFADLDVTNAFHQFKLGEVTSKMLSIVTPKGSFRPKFLLEGTTPATGILHQNMVDIFRDFDEWTIVLFDNILLLAHDQEDLTNKMELFLTRCKERNIFLKFEKSWIGVTEVNFFGYICSHNSFRLSEERTKALLEIPFPESCKQMQSFLGSCIFFKVFIAYFSDLAAPLHDMTHKSFDWANKDSWTKDYKAAFETMKKALAQSFTLYYPDYNLPWTLRVDASTLGVGSVLLQETAEGQMQPIMFKSQKFSKQASNWSTIEQECYAIFHAVQSMEFYLRCKPFVIETDHRNLIWMEQSLVPKIIRWRIYLQSFHFLIRHIPGKTNIVADMLSRQWESPLDEVEKVLNHVVTVATDGTDSFEAIMSQVHGRRNGHHGVHRTWDMLNRRYPGHGIKIQQVADYIHCCPTCQKDRLLKVSAIPPTVKTLHVEHAHSMVCADLLEMPRSTDGMQYILTVVNMFTRHVMLYAIPDKEAVTVAGCFMRYISVFGLFDELRTDRGSEFTAKVLAHLLDWLGPFRTLALTGRPQADGAEGTNREIRRHLIAICLDENVKREWSSDKVLPFVQLVLNEKVHLETGVQPLQAQFGDADAIYAQIPAGLPVSEATHEYVKVLSANLDHVRKVSAQYQAAIRDERIAKSPVASNNRYPAGTFVLRKLGKFDRKDKLTARFAGPYRVLAHDDHNWVTVQDLVQKIVHTFDISELSVFVGSEEAAQLAANYDYEQHHVNDILGFRGDPAKRSTMEFLLQFSDGEQHWLPFGPDLVINLAFQDFCNARRPLTQLLDSASIAQKQKTAMKNLDITSVAPKTTVYVDIREWGWGWYDRLSLPDKDTVTYVMECQYTRWAGTKKRPHSHIIARFEAIPISAKEYKVDNYFVYLYGSQLSIRPGEVLLTRDMIEKFKIPFPKRA